MAIQLTFWNVGWSLENVRGLEISNLGKLAHYKIDYGKWL